MRGVVRRALKKAGAKVLRYREFPERDFGIITTGKECIAVLDDYSVAEVFYDGGEIEFYPYKIKNGKAEFLFPKIDSVIREHELRGDIHVVKWLKEVVKNRL